MTRQRRMRATSAPTRAAVGIAVALLLPSAMMACTVPTTAAPPTPTSAPTASGAFEPGEGDRSGLVDLGGGRDVYLECNGTGSPAVVFISGAGVAGDNWQFVDADPAEPSESAVFPQTARFTTACTYDRPGTQQWLGAASRSTTVPQPTTSQNAAADLHAILAAAEVTGPYVIVGHSWGGLIATTFARIYPDDVSGLVLVDPASQYLQTVLPPEVWADWIQHIAATGGQHPELESPDYPASIAALEATPPLRAVPGVVFSADQPFDFLGIDDTDAFWPQWLETHMLLATSFGALQVTETNSGHFVANASPKLVIEQICAAVAPAQGC